MFGIGAFADLACYYFTHDSPYTVAAFTVDADYLREPTFNRRPVVAFEDVERAFPPADHDMFVAVGFHKLNAARAAKVADAEAKGYRAASFLSSRAGVSPGLVVRPNTMIMEGAYVHPFVEIGRNTIVWSLTRIAFRTRIGDDCWIVSAVFGESVTVGDHTFIGLNATIAPGITVGRRNVIGAGALVVRDTRDDEVYRAVASRPAKARSSRLRGF